MNMMMNDAYHSGTGDADKTVTSAFVWVAALWQSVHAAGLTFEASNGETRLSVVYKQLVRTESMRININAGVNPDGGRKRVGQIRGLGWDTEQIVHVYQKKAGFPCARWLRIGENNQLGDESIFLMSRIW